MQLHSHGQAGSQYIRQHYICNTTALPQQQKCDTRETGVNLDGEGVRVCCHSCGNSRVRHQAEDQQGPELQSVPAPAPNTRAWPSNNVLRPSMMANQESLKGSLLASPCTLRRHMQTTELLLVQVQCIQTMQLSLGQLQPQHLNTHIHSL